MPYIGKNLVGILKDARASDTMTGDGSDTTLTLTDTPGSTNNVLVFLDGIRQTPVTDYWVTGRNLTFTTAPEAGVLVVALTGSASSIDPKMGSVTSSKIVDGMVGNAKIATLSASKLTGALPAISGAALTNVTSSTGIDNVNSDPTISTNPAGGVGTIQLNQVSGEMYVCTDATAGANVWLNVGGGSVDVYVYQGTVTGFLNRSANIYGTSFSSDGDGALVGNLITHANIAAYATTQNKTHGYSLGGVTYSPTVYYNNIEKFAFAATVTSVAQTGTIGTPMQTNLGHNSRTHGYVTGGVTVFNPLAVNSNRILKYSYASDTDANQIGTSVLYLRSAYGHSTKEYGFVRGGINDTSAGASPAGNINTGDKFSFLSDSNAVVNPGTLTTNRRSGMSTASITHAYCLGGHDGAFSNVMDKYAFVSSGNSTDVGDLTQTTINGSGASSTTYGYIGGGSIPAATTRIEKHSFSADGNATNIGDLAGSGTEADGNGWQY